VRWPGESGFKLSKTSLQVRSLAILATGSHLVPQVGNVALSKVDPSWMRHLHKVQAWGPKLT